jgi:excisionase family DNA binding protein
LCDSSSKEIKDDAQRIAPTDQGLKLALTYREAASAIGVCERTIWQLVRDGKLKSKRVTTKSVRIPVAEIARFINEEDEL